MSSTGTAIFLEPQGVFRSVLLEKKALLEARMPGQAYTQHPPHATLLFGDYGSPDLWLTTLESRLARIKTFSVTTVGWQEFPHDILAGGGHTVAFRVGLTEALLSLQLAVAEELSPFRTAIPSHPLASIEPFATSLKRYGFPFVGRHWIPHLTIGSPCVPPYDPLLVELKSNNTSYSVDVNSISVWSVNGDNHQRLAELALQRSESAI
jgi:2'-5' RNA ligase